MFLQCETNKIFGFFLLITSVCCRRYDIEEEAQKLYREDLATVLTRFRRSPDYLKILQEKQEEMFRDINDISLQVLFYYQNTKFPQVVMEKLHLNSSKTTCKEEPTTEEAKNLRHGKRHGAKYRRDGDEAEKEGVQKLDKYKKLYSPFTLKQRNSLRDLGFQYAGKVIHTVIKSFSDVNDEVPSTQQPGGAIDDVGTTTEHPSEHIVTNMADVASDATEPAATDANDEKDQDKDEARQGAHLRDDPKPPGKPRIEAAGFRENQNKRVSLNPKDEIKRKRFSDNRVYY